MQVQLREDMFQLRHYLTRAYAGLPTRIAVTLPVFLLLCLQASEASFDALSENMYVRTGAGIFFLDMSDSSPFIRTNGKEEVVDTLEHYDAEYEDGGLASLTIGKEYDRRFSELSGFLTSYTSRHTSEYSEDPSPWTDIRTRFQDQYCPQGTEIGACISSETEQHLVALIKDDPHIRSVGWVGKIDGDAIPYGSPNFAWGDPIRIRTKREVDFHGLDLVTGKHLEQTERSGTSIYIGPSYKKLSQETETFAYESNRPPTVNHLTLKEDLDASYYGAAVGTRIDFSLRPSWNLMLDGRLGVYYLDSEYDGFQRTFLSSAMPVLDEETDHKTSDSQWAATLSLQTSLNFAFHQRVTISIGAGAEYLSDVPTMRYAKRGESFASGDAHSPARIEYSDAFGFFSTISLEFR